MKMKLMLVPVPVSDIDRAKSFYVEKVGFKIKVDVKVSAARRVVQLTPPGSACSIVFGTGMPKIKMQTGSLRGLHLAVEDIASTRRELLSKGVKVSKIEREGDKDGDSIQFASFSDPDGNSWALFQ
jgi:predicted enzyme related to lactoylglutathione lyase